jgi:hypothetical protein
VPCDPRKSSAMRLNQFCRVCSPNPTPGHFTPIRSESESQIFSFFILSPPDTAGVCFAAVECNDQGLVLRDLRVPWICAICGFASRPCLAFNRRCVSLQFSSTSQSGVHHRLGLFPTAQFNFLLAHHSVRPLVGFVRCCCAAQVYVPARQVHQAVRQRGEAEHPSVAGSLLFGGQQRL